MIIEKITVKKIKLIKSKNLIRTKTIDGEKNSKAKKIMNYHNVCDDFKHYHHANDSKFIEIP